VPIGISSSGEQLDQDEHALTTAFTVLGSASLTAGSLVRGQKPRSGRSGPRWSQLSLR
jgi:hypothetical protein